MVVQDFFGHGIGRVQIGDGKKVRGHRAPGPFFSFPIAHLSRTAAHQTHAEKIAALYADPTTNGS